MTFTVYEKISHTYFLFSYFPYKNYSIFRALFPTILPKTKNPRNESFDSLLDFSTSRLSKQIISKNYFWWFSNFYSSSFLRLLATANRLPNIANPNPAKPVFVSVAPVFASRLTCCFSVTLPGTALGIVGEPGVGLLGSTGVGFSGSGCGCTGFGCGLGISGVGGVGFYTGINGFCIF